MQFIKDLTPKYSKIPKRVELYKNSKGNLLVVKNTNQILSPRDTKYLSNEATILKKLNTLKGLASIVPRLIFYKKILNKVQLATQAYKGVHIDTLDKRTRILIVTQVLNRLQNISINSLPSKSTLYFFAGIIPYYLRICLRNPGAFFFYTTALGRFYLNYALGHIGGINYDLSHRDLWPDNILYDKKSKKITVLDWESATLTDSLYDLSQTAMIYHKDFETSELITLLRNYLESNSKQKRFVALAIYNSFHTLARTKKKSKEYKAIVSFLNLLHSDIAPALYFKKSLFETINEFTLDSIWLFYKLTGFSITSKNKKLMLCYHSVGNDGWRFSTKVKEFESHIQTLKKNYPVMEIDKLLKSKFGGVTISFDDGYKNLLTNAVPLLKKHQINPVLFMLGNPNLANREELDNDLPLLTLDDVKALHKKGWSIGFHTMTHPDISSLADHELNEEVVEGKKITEKKLGFILDYFAYPKGFHSHKVVQYIKRAGFKAAFTVDGAAIENNKNRLLLDRIPVSGELTPHQLLAMLSPVGLWISQLYLKILQIKESLSLKQKYKLSLSN